MKVSSIHVDRDVPMSARDGVILRSDVIRPGRVGAGPGDRVPHAV